MCVLCVVVVVVVVCLGYSAVAFSLGRFRTPALNRIRPSLLFPASYRAPRRCFLACSLLLPSSLRFILLLIVFSLAFCPLVASLRISFILNRVSLSLSSSKFYKPIASFAPRDAFRRKTPSRCPARARTQ